MPGLNKLRGLLYQVLLKNDYSVVVNFGSTDGFETMAIAGIVTINFMPRMYTITLFKWLTMITSPEEHIGYGAVVIVTRVVGCTIKQLSLNPLQLYYDVILRNSGHGLRNANGPPQV